jgi:hypothetical protein
VTSQGVSIEYDFPGGPYDLSQYMVDGRLRGAIVFSVYLENGESVSQLNFELNTNNSNNRGYFWIPVFSGLRDIYNYEDKPFVSGWNHLIFDFDEGFRSTGGNIADETNITGISLLINWSGRNGPGLFHAPLRTEISEILFIKKNAGRNYLCYPQQASFKSEWWRDEMNPNDYSVTLTNYSGYGEALRYFPDFEGDITGIFTRINTEEGGSLGSLSNHNLLISTAGNLVSVDILNVGNGQQFTAADSFVATDNILISSLTKEAKINGLPLDYGVDSQVPDNVVGGNTYLIVTNRTNDNLVQNLTYNQEDRSTVAKIGTPASNGQTVFQTFTAGLTGTLFRVKLLLRSNTKARMNLSLYSTSAGVPSTFLAGSSQVLIMNSLSLEEYTFFFSLDSPVSLTSGTVYALGLFPFNTNSTLEQTDIYIASNSTSSYAGGQVYIRNYLGAYTAQTRDIYFQIYTANTGTFTLNYKLESKRRYL